MDMQVPSRPRSGDIQVVLSQDVLCQAYQRRQEHMAAYKRNVEQAMDFLRTTRSKQDGQACRWLQFVVEVCPHELGACPRPA
eukprot:11213076-Lingulodinium_polyedra.AAC.1